MKITALEIKEHEFEKSFRGYNIEEVDIFLNSIASEWERSGNEAKMLRMQLEIAEKEAAKLREVEMSLIKALQNAETTNAKITEQAKNQAEKKVEDATLEAQRILEDAKIEANEKLIDANSQVTENQNLLEAKEEVIKSEISTLEGYRSDLINQLKTLSTNTLSKIENFNIQPEEKVEKEIKKEEVKNKEVKDEEQEVKGFASSANTLVLESPQEEVSDLTVVEGIGDKISELLSSHDIKTYRDLATIPAYKLKEILDTGGAKYAMHDPGTWAEQAILAESGKWEELNALKEHLIGGKEPEEISQVQVTEEMLNRVNKVKAALKKAMLSKESEQTESKEATTTQNESKQTSSEGSFFDNLG